MVKHVSIGHKCVRLVSVDLNAEDARCNHHSKLTVLFQGELLILGNLFANHRVVSLDVFNFIGDLILERTALKPLTFLLSVENWEVVESLRQNVNESREA